MISLFCLVAAATAWTENALEAFAGLAAEAAYAKDDAADYNEDTDSDRNEHS
jgi:hypothetical protein